MMSSSDAMKSIMVIWPSSRTSRSQQQSSGSCPVRGRDLGKALAQERVILGAVKAGEVDAVPAGQTGDVIKPAAAFDAPGQLPTGSGVAQTVDHRVHAALQKLRRQDVQQLGGAGGGGVDVAADVQSLLPRLL